MIAKVTLVALAATACAYANQIIVNGGFETGTLSGWTVTNQSASPNNSFYASNSTSTPVNGINGYNTVGAQTGSYYAVSDGGGTGTSILSQSIVVPAGATSVIFAFGLFVNSDVGTYIDSAGDLNYGGAANQYGLVSLLSAGTSLFSTTTGDLRNFYKGTDSGTIPNKYTNYSFNITSLVSGGGTFIVRFAEVNNQDVLNMGIDNVSVNITTGSATPEPSSIPLAITGLAGIAIYCGRGRRTPRAMVRTLRRRYFWARPDLPL